MFYLFVLALVVLDAVLLRSPNLLGKIGLIIYKYHYLRTFPKAFITVTIVIAVAAIISELIQWLVKRESIKRGVAVMILIVLTLVCVAMLGKTAMDFSTWTYSHTGARFRYGAYLLPIILIVIFVYAMITLPKPHVLFPPSPTMEEENKEQ